MVSVDLGLCVQNDQEIGSVQNVEKELRVQATQYETLSQLIRSSDFANFRKSSFDDLNQKSTKSLFSIFAIDKLSKKNSINEKYAFSI